MEYCTPIPLYKMNSLNIMRSVSQQYSLQHLEFYECSLDTLYPILACCPKLLHLKFEMNEYPQVAQFEQLASKLTALVPSLDCLHCSYIHHTNSQDGCDYRLQNKENVLQQIRQMHRLFQNVSCDDSYDYCPHEGGTSWDYLAISFEIIGGNQSVFVFK
jgi:hypothetical protein